MGEMDEDATFGVVDVPGVVDLGVCLGLPKAALVEDGVSAQLFVLEERGGVLMVEVEAFGAMGVGFVTVAALRGVPRWFSD